MLTQVVTAASTTTTVSSTPAAPVYGRPLTFTATVATTEPGAVAPTGTVQFFIDGTAAGAPVPVSTANGLTTADLEFSGLLSA
ncbi:Ig-like domain repeat protein, partial [Zavarzinella formosa]|uniref:Ig-like domain repeat protein n=1 Tax=Zavarzinella formosa TaxID=360055 RepID=UPI001EE68377